MHRVAGPPALRTGARGFDGKSRLKLRSLDQLVSWTCDDHHSVMDGRGWTPELLLYGSTEHASHGFGYAAGFGSLVGPPMGHPSVVCLY